MIFNGYHTFYAILKECSEESKRAWNNYMESFKNKSSSAEKEQMRYQACLARMAERQARENFYKSLEG